MAKQPWEKYLSNIKILFFRLNEKVKINEKRVLTQNGKGVNIKSYREKAADKLFEKKLKKFLTKTLNDDKMSELRQSRTTNRTLTNKQ